MAYNLGTNLMLATALTQFVTVERTEGTQEIVDFELVNTNSVESLNIQAIVAVPKDNELNFINTGSIQSTSFKKFHSRFRLRMGEEATQTIADVVVINTPNGQERYTIVNVGHSDPFGFTRAIGVRINA